MKKHRNVENFNKLKINVNKAIDRVKPENYKNYFNNAYNLKGNIKLQRKQKQYKYTYCLRPPKRWALNSLCHTTSLLALYAENPLKP